ncbi:MAG: diguanylate cyclase [Thermodesulfobacteriota bacterium]
MKLYRPKIGVAPKTWIALSVVFWVPVTALVLVLFYLFQGVVYEETLGSVKANLKASRGVYEQRGEEIEALLVQLSGRPEVRKAFSSKDAQALQKTLLEFGKNNPHVDILAAVDENQRVLGRRSARAGDILNIGDILPMALISGEATSSSELVRKEFFSAEDETVPEFAWNAGITQFIVSPVRHEGKVVGAVVAGILLSGDPWLGNAVYERFGVDLALFAGTSPETALLHATSSLPRSSWALGQPIPEGLKKEISLDRPYYGVLEVSGVKNIVAYEPLRDSRNKIIGVLGVGMPAKSITAVVFNSIAKGAGVAAVIGLILAAVMTGVIRSDIIRPLNFLVTAMDRLKKGEMDISVNLTTGDEFEKLGNGFNTMVDGINEREERLKKHNEVAKLLMSTLDLRELLERVLKIAVEVTDSQMGIVYLVEGAGESLHPHVKYGTKADLSPLKMGEGFPGRAAEKKTTLRISPPAGEAVPDEAMELGFAKAIPKEIGYIPLVYQERVLGVLVLGSSTNYTDEEVQLFDYLANQICIALDNAIMHQKIQEMSITDPLTGLYNRRYLNTRLTEEWSRSLRYKRPISIVLYDIDNFKAINDTYGHDKGDEVLKAVAEVMRNRVRKQDIAARFGGEEFVVVLGDTEEDDARKFAESIGGAIKELSFEWLEKPVTVSGGIGTFPKIDVESYQELLQAADQAMYKAKMSGKDRVEVGSGADVKES